MAKRASVPKFGTWDSDNVGYTVYFQKVRENKVATAPPLQRPLNPEDEQAARLVAPGSRPATSSGHRAAAQHNMHQHRRAGSSSNVAPDRAGRGAEQSKFAPPPQYHPRPQPAHHLPSTGHGGDHGQHNRPAGHGGDHGHHQRPAGHGGHHKPHDARYRPPGPRARSASPSHPPGQGRQRPTAVPKFGAWDEQSAAAQGYTVQFDKVKRDREMARGAVPGLPRRRMPSPESYEAARQSRHTTFYSKMFGCLIPHTRE